MTTRSRPARRAPWHRRRVAAPEMRLWLWAQRDSIVLVISA